MARISVKTTIVMLGLLLPSLPVAAQTVPGGRDVDGNRLHAGVWTVTMSMQRGEQKMVMGSTRYELKQLDGAEPHWQLVTTTTSQLGVATDTSVARRVGLEPVRHRSHAVPRKLMLDYAGNTVTGQYIPTSGPARDIRRNTEVATFDAAMLDLVLGALPLATGYTTRLPMYIEEQEGLTWFDVSVTGEQKVNDETGWVVRVTNARYTVDFTIGRQSRAFLAGRVQYPNGVSVELTKS